MRIFATFLIMLLLRGYVYAADSDFNELLSSFQNINVMLGLPGNSPSCNIPEELTINFCTSPSDFLCKDVVHANELASKGRLAFDKVALKALLDRNATGNLEFHGDKLRPNIIENGTQGFLQDILQNKKHKSHIMLNFNYTLAANDMLQNSPSTQKELQKLLDRVKEGVRRFLETSDRFGSCKDNALSRLSRVKFADLRKSDFGNILSLCGGSTLTENAEADRTTSEIMLCPGILKSGFVNNDYEYLAPILAHEIGHILIGDLSLCYPSDCISQLPGGFMLDEKQAEWFAVQSLPFVLNENGNPHKAQLEKVLFQYGQHLCRSEDIASTNGSIGSHPTKEDRLDVYYGKDQRIREILNCPKEESVKNCN